MIGGMEQLIEMKNISKAYTRNGANIQALNEVNLKVAEGDIFGVIGYSCAGKSTLIRLINFIERPTSGKVLINGVDLDTYTLKQLRQARKNIGMIIQHYNILNSKTIYHSVVIPLVLYKNDKMEINARVMELLDVVRLADKAVGYTNELSGGQKQRIGIVRALATKPSILI